MPSDGPENFIFVSEATCPGTNQFMPLASDWCLSEDEENGKWWVVVPNPDSETGTWDAEIIQTAKRAEIPEPTFKGDQNTSIFSQQTFSRDQLKEQIQQNGLRKQLIAVAYHDSDNELAFRKPTAEEKQDLENSQDSLTKCIYLNDDQELRKRMDTTIGSKELSFNQKLISFITSQATSQLFKEIDQNEEPQTASEIKDLISEGTGMFLLKNILLEKWDPKQKKASVFQGTVPSENFPLRAEFPISQVPKQLEAAIDSTLQQMQNMFNLIDPNKLEPSPFIILNPREIEEPRIEEKSKKTVIIKAEDIYHWEKGEDNTHNTKWDHNSPYLEFLTDDLLARVRRGTCETVDRETRKNKLTETFSGIKKYLKDDGILAVLCEEGHGEIVEDVKESLKEAGFEVERNWEIERSGVEKGKGERVVVGRKGKKVNEKCESLSFRG